MNQYLAILITILTLSLALGCTPRENTLAIKFLPSFNSQPVECNQPLSINEVNWQLTQLQLMLHDLQLKDASQQWHPAKLLVKLEQDPQVALIGVVCPAQPEWQVTLLSQLARTEITGIKFIVGVPQSLNHLNPLTQLSPLNQSDMFWTWQLGHKFARIEMASNDAEWLFHLGSTGCSSPSPVRAPTSECTHPNRANIVIENFNPTQTIKIDLSALVNDLDLMAHTECQSSLTDESCRLLLPRFGIGGTQQVFSAGERVNE